MEQATTKRGIRIDAQYLAGCLTRANRAAIAADPGEAEDGGSCCLDTATIKLPNVRQSVIDEAVKMSGVRVGDRMTGYWHGYRFVFTETKGQAHRRELMSEAAYKSLLNDGLQARHYQQMD